MGMNMVGAFGGSAENAKGYLKSPNHQGDKGDSGEF